MVLHNKTTIAMSSTCGSKSG